MAEVTQADEEEGPCTTCWDTGITIQTERPCSCDAAYHDPAAIAQFCAG